MKFPAYWTRVQNERGTVTARGWSEVSLQHATENARNRLQRILAALKRHDTFDLERYRYVIDNVICEEIIDHITDGDQQLAVVSRNHYASLVLNAARMMFIDIDFPPPPRTNAGCLLGWLVKPTPSAQSPQDKILDEIRQWQSQNADISLRIYRTAAGVRVIVVNRVFDSVGDQAVGLMRALGADSLYIKLCQSQSCFRARLTPKPWRIGLPDGMKKPPEMFPFFSETGRQSFESWHQRYVEQAEKFKVCQFLETIGNEQPLAEHLPLIELHDQFCCHAHDLALA